MRGHFLAANDLPRFMHTISVLLFVVVSTLLLSLDPDFGFFRHLTHGDFSPAIGTSAISKHCGASLDPAAQGKAWTMFEAFKRS